ncbi:5814_t:CDS:1, partial [Racocetra persica]
SMFSGITLYQIAPALITMPTAQTSTSTKGKASISVQTQLLLQLNNYTITTYSMFYN